MEIFGVTIQNTTGILLGTLCISVILLVVFIIAMNKDNEHMKVGKEHNIEDEGGTVVKDEDDDE